MHRVTPDNITVDDIGFVEELYPQEPVFVFGSNEAGLHIGGAAKLAYDRLGARHSVGFGRQADTFAIPTKDWNVESLALNFIEFYCKRFIEYTKTEEAKYNIFYVTEIGCGLAGYKPEDIAPFFKEALNLENVYLPQRFITVLTK